MTRMFAVMLLVSMVACNTAEEKFDSESYQLTKEKLEDREKRHPEQFLIATGSDKKNLFGQTVIRGSISSKASVCTYKDVQLKFIFYSKTGVLLEENKETIYEIIPPNNTVKFKTKYFAPKGTDSVNITIIGATVEALAKTDSLK